MSKTQIGPVQLLISELGGREERVRGSDNDDHDAWVIPALAIGPHQTLLELSLRRWIGGGEVVMNGKGDSHPHFQRLVQGCRLGIKDNEQGAGTAMVGRTVWDFEKNWASVKLATVDDLDELLEGDSRNLLVAHGTDQLDTRAALWRDTSKKKNFLEAQFDPDDPQAPLAIYALTRILPVFAAVELAVGS